VILQRALETDAAAFLQRWGRYLRPQHLDRFRALDSFDVRHHLGQLEFASDASRVAKRTRNRRLKCMQRLLREGSYFSEEEMSRRRPALHHEYVGRHLTSDEAAAKASATNDKSWSDQLLEVVLNRDVRERREATRLREGWDDEGNSTADMATEVPVGDVAPPGRRGADDIEEFDTDDDESDGMPLGADAAAGDAGGMLQVERIRLRGEFERLMREAFLAGQDVQFFDYSAVDDNGELDDVDVRGWFLALSWHLSRTCLSVCALEPC